MIDLALLLAPPDPLVRAGALAVAWALDWRFGEPPDAWHPVAWIGRALGPVGPRLCALPSAAAFAGGALAWLAGAALLVAGAAGLQAAVCALPALPAAALLGLLLKPAFAMRMLCDEVEAVEEALGRGLDEGRARLARLVSRDVSALDATAVREAAIETLAENLNDSVISPLLAFAVAGLPGAVLYRFANTADAMWGYRGRWNWAGRWAARADDVLSWPGARLAALLLRPSPRPSALAALAREARRTPSPNGGWPMGAMALRLDVLLRKPGVYALHSRGRPPEAADLRRALALARTAAGRGMTLLAGGLLGLAMLTGGAGGPV